MFDTVFKDSAASKKAWLKRTRANLTFGGKEKGWLDEDGKPIGANVKAAMQRAKSPVPPGWTSVEINLDPNDPLVATGIDAKGRKQRLYSKEHTQAAALDKFKRVAEFEKHVGKVLTTSTSEMMNAKLSEKQRDIAATTNLMLKAGFRPGSTKDTGGDEQAYGASTLEKRHVKVNGDKINFKFTGKHGVEQNKTLEDGPLAGYLGQKLRNLKTHDRVFNASSQDVGDYLKATTGADFKAKDIRTWNGTALARHLVNQYKAPKNESELKALQKEVSTKVAAHLGNTPAMAFGSYINPLVWPSVSATAKVKKAK